MHFARQIRKGNAFWAGNLVIAGKEALIKS
jgi:hypothetical protein